MNEIKDEVLNWFLNSKNKGLSSVFLAKVSTCDELEEYNFPLDNSDFKRCVLFKQDCPHAFKKAKEILTGDMEDLFDYDCNVSKVWQAYFENWDKMETLLYEQLENKNNGKELYSIMQKIQENSRAK